MQHALVALQYEKSSSYSIYIFVISLFEYPGPSPRSPPSARHWFGLSLQTDIKALNKVEAYALNAFVSTGIMM